MRRKQQGGDSEVGRWRRFAAFLAGGLFLGSLVGCQSLLDVELPTQIDAAVLDSPGLAETMVLSVQNEFECMYSNYVKVTAVFTDEAWTSTTSGGYGFLNTRNVFGEGGFEDCAERNPPLYGPWYRARWVADDVIGRLEAFSEGDVPARSTLLARTRTLAGYILAVFGEMYCEAVIQEQGPALSPPEVLRAAEAQFTEALSLAAATGHTQSRDRARMGRARVRLALGDFAGAVSDAREVPVGFRFDATYSGDSVLRENQVYVDMHRNRQFTVKEKWWDLAVAGMPDPRVRVTVTGGLGPDGETPMALADKYAAGPGAPVRVGSWEEAQLIIAEAELQGGNLAGAVESLNAVRAVYEIPPIASETASQRETLWAQFVQDRERTLFMEGRRIADVNRLGLEWEAGLNFKGDMSFNPDVTCIPLPTVEIRQNPNARSNS